MLKRKVEYKITQYLEDNNSAILLVDGARQVGKTYSIRKVCKKLYKNFIEINFVEDSLDKKLFENITTVHDFYLQLSLSYGDMLHQKKDTIVFLDEIQQYPNFLTLLKFLKDDNKYTYIASGSLLGVTLAQTSSIPIGSIHKMQMKQLDFEEFLWANGVDNNAIEMIGNTLKNKNSLPESAHNKIMDYFKKYLIVGGMPAIVQEYVDTNNMYQIRKMQAEIHEYYGIDAAKYEMDKNLKIKTIYDYVPSAMENKKKRVQVNKLENKKGATFTKYKDEFDYLISSGIVCAVNAISNPTFPLVESLNKNLLKLYLNDVGILTCLLYRDNIKSILEDESSVNLGSVYETAVANELASHGHRLFYYDNRKKGEVDFLIDDYDAQSILPIEVKSGKDYYVHSALSAFSKNENYNCKSGLVLSNEREVSTKGIITYMPIYYVMFLGI